MGIGLLIASEVYHVRLGGAYEQMTADHGSVNSEYEALVIRKRLLERYHRRYEMFRTHGFVANERRVDLLEVLREAGEEVGLPSLRYSLEPQRVLTPPPSIESDGIRLHASRVDLELGLLHELDLLRLLKLVRAEVPGLVSVDRCALVRQGDVPQPSSSDPNIGATCSLWLFSVATSDVAAEVRPAMKSAWRTGVIGLVALLRVATAEDLYGEEENTPLGRVFLTPEQRRALDARRFIGSSDETLVAVPADAKSVPPEKEVVGLIIGPNGKTLVWLDGEFRPALQEERSPREARERKTKSVLRDTRTND